MRALVVLALLLAPGLSWAGVPVQAATSATILEVETNTRAIRIIAKALDFMHEDVRGCYSFSGTSGVITTNLAANAPLFSARYDPGVPSDRAVIYYLRIDAMPLTPYTGLGNTAYPSMDAFFVRAFSVSHGGGTSPTLTVDNLKNVTAAGITGFADLRIATTAALTAGTGALFPTHPFLQTIRKGNRTTVDGGVEETITGATAGNAQGIFSVGDGEAPIVLSKQEGIVVRNRTVMPAAGTTKVDVAMRWCEVTRY